MELTPESFLESKGIILKTTALFTIVDGYIRQPDLVTLLREYANQKIHELDIKLTPESNLLLKRIEDIKKDNLHRCPNCKSEKIFHEMGGFECAECKHCW